MNVLLAGSNTYLAGCLIPFLLQNGHEVVCLARDKKLFLARNKFAGVKVIQGDLLRKAAIEPFPVGTDAAFYLGGRLTQTTGFAGLEVLSARNFMDALDQTRCRQVITSSELNNPKKQAADDVLADGHAAFTCLQLSMVIGGGNIPMELFDSLTHHNTTVITSAWAEAQIQPIYINDVLTYLHDSLLNEATFGNRLSVCGPAVLSFKQMIEEYCFAFKPGKKNILVLPSLSTRLASYIANFLAPLSYPDAQSLLANLQYNSVSDDTAINNIIPHECVSFKQSLKLMHDQNQHTIPA